MHNVEDRERSLNMYFGERKCTTEISEVLHLPRNTVKSWIRRYTLENGESGRSDKYRDQLWRQRPDTIKVTRSYKTRETSQEKSAEERIARLEMEIDLLRNFLLGSERR